MAPITGVDDNHDDAHTVVRKRVLARKRIRKTTAEVQQVKSKLANKILAEDAKIDMELIECDKLINMYAWHEAPSTPSITERKSGEDLGKH